MLLNIQWVYAYILQDVYEENLKPERPFTCYSILASKDYSCLMDGHLVALFIGCKFNKLLKLLFTCTHPFLFFLITISFFQFILKYIHHLLQIVISRLLTSLSALSRTICEIMKGREKASGLASGQVPFSCLRVLWLIPGDETSAGVYSSPQRFLLGAHLSISCKNQFNFS